MIQYRNTKLLKDDQLKYLKSLSKFVLDKFFSEEKQKALKIKIIFKKDLFKDQNMYGNCVWEDDNYRPEEFTIEMEPDQKTGLLLNTLAHELVHVKQWAKGEYYQLIRTNNLFKFNGQRVDADKTDYWDLPWEIEAHGRAIGLVVQWARKNNLKSKIDVDEV